MKCLKKLGYDVERDNSKELVLSDGKDYIIFLKEHKSMIIPPIVSYETLVAIYGLAKGVFSSK